MDTNTITIFSNFLTEVGGLTPFIDFALHDGVVKIYPASMQKLTKIQPNQPEIYELLKNFIYEF